MRRGRRSMGCRCACIRNWAGCVNNCKTMSWHSITIRSNCNLRGSGILCHNRKENDHANELDAYDSIGMQYYYLRNIDKAMYYHSRMMYGKVEKETPEKLGSLEKLLKSRDAKNFKNYSNGKTDFGRYCDKDSDFVYPHENFAGLKEFDIKFLRLEKKELPPSPKYERANVKENLLKRALNKLLYDSRRDYTALRELNNKYRENKRKCKSVNSSVSEQVKQQKNLLLSNRKVVVVANK
eukprot:TRINITY_DN11624_c0_g2_i5.p1 TRINITY_DN11624_c0_g2~~TRINITY_DN11624_c0_g2_i5.p1  ORF type:complete len:238 (-),score=31.02 TRINITY_DN11624_c0_g2_i5:462-1175(-)